MLQRLLELESYRYMALTAIPLVQAAMPRIASISDAHQSIIKELNNPHMDYSGEQKLLDQICKLSARAEEMVRAGVKKNQKKKTDSLQ